MTLSNQAYERDDFEVSDQLIGWADIKESQKTGNVLYAQAIGIEQIPVNGRTEECLKLNYKGNYGYLPITLIDNYNFKGLQNFLGKTFEFVVEHVDLESQLFVANRIKALEELSNSFWKRVQEGQIYDAFVRGIDPYNLYLLVDGVETKMHRDEYSYSYIEDLREEVEIGDTVPVKIIRAVKPNQKFELKRGNGNIVEVESGENGYLEVSTKALEEDPWNNIVNYKEKATYLGTITKVHMIHGLFIELEPGLTVRTNFPPNANGHLFRVGEQVNVKLLKIDPENRKMTAIVIMPKQSNRNRQRQRIYRRGVRR